MQKKNILMSEPQRRHTCRMKLQQLTKMNESKMNKKISSPCNGNCSGCGFFRFHCYSQTVHSSNLNIRIDRSIYIYEYEYASASGTNMRCEWLRDRSNRMNSQQSWTNCSLAIRLLFHHVTQAILSIFSAMFLKKFC